MLQIIRDTSGNQGLPRTDLRFGIGPDDEIYVLNKRDGVIRKFISASGLLDGDADRDGDVDGADFLAWQRGFGAADADWSDGNFDADATADADDLALWESNFGGRNPIAAIPEPASSLGLALGAVLLVTGRRMNLACS